MRCPIVLYCFAAALIAGGVVGYNLSPEGQGAAVFFASAGFGAIAAALAATAAVLGVNLNNRRATLAGRTAGFALALLMALLFVWLATDRAKAGANHRQALAQYHELVSAGAVQDNERTLRAHLQGAGVPEHDPSPQANALWGLAGASFLTLCFLVWALQRDSEAAELARARQSPLRAAA